MNKAIVIGRLTRDIELKYTNSGKAVANFTVAVDRRGEGVDFVDVTVWEKVAESCAQYIGKGSQVCVSGRIQVDNYEKDGQKRKSFAVVAEQVTFLDSKKEKQEDPF